MLARSRRDTACRSPEVRGKARTRRDGGMKGSGAPTGNANAFRHGYHNH